jgi:chemotaxis protein MotB
MNSHQSNFQEYLKAESTSASTEWMVTFVDLLCLMLVFFIMIYATTSVNNQKWNEIKDSMGNSFKPSNVINKPYEKELYATKIDIKRGVDIDYLHTIIAGKINAASFLKNKIILERSNGNLTIIVDDTNLFEGNTTVLTTDSRALLFIIGDILQRVNNKIDVVGYTLGDIDNDKMEGWSLSLSRALEVASKIREYGNLSQLEAVVKNSDIAEAEDKPANTIEIVISPNTK